MFTLTTPQQFLRQARKFLKKHPDLKPRFAKLLADLQQDRFHPHLELHPLTGKLSDCHAVSPTYNYRTTLTLLITNRKSFSSTSGVMMRCIVKDLPYWGHIHPSIILQQWSLHFVDKMPPL